MGYTNEIKETDELEEFEKPQPFMYVRRFGSLGDVEE